MPPARLFTVCSPSQDISSRGQGRGRSGSSLNPQLLGTVPGTQWAPNSMALSTHHVLGTTLRAVTYLILKALWAGANPGLVRPDAE